jgi:hypothetical protein
MLEEARRLEAWRLAVSLAAVLQDARVAIKLAQTSALRALRTRCGVQLI